MKNRSIKLLALILALFLVSSLLVGFDNVQTQATLETIPETSMTEEAKEKEAGLYVSGGRNVEAAKYANTEGTHFPIRPYGWVHSTAHGLKWASGWVRQALT